MKVWLTLHALTDGITQEEAATYRVRQSQEWIDDPNFVAVQGVIVAKPDWHATREDAITRAEEMRLNKIAWLEKQLAKLKAMQFE